MQAELQAEHGADLWRPADGTPVIFLHGWPDLALGWRHQLLALGALGFRALAPDMRGYGQSTVHPAKTDYALEACVADMLELLASTGREAAVWVGHDLGAPVAWAIASHHPERTLAVAALLVWSLGAVFKPAPWMAPLAAAT